MEENKSLSFVPEFYYDIIARFIPGILIVALYRFEYLDNDLNIQTIIFGILISYLLGFILDMVSEFLWNTIFFKRDKIVKLVYKSRNFYSQENVWKFINTELNMLYSGKMVKMMAEFALFRIITIIPFIYVLYRPKIFEDISGLNYFLFSFLLFVLLLFCTVKRYISICQTVDSFKIKEQK